MSTTPPTDHFRMQMSNGKFFYYARPDEADYNIWVIAHALSQLCRFHGHSTEPYSVAQHSVLVSQACPPEDALAGLLHDANEAFMQDVGAPLKRWLKRHCPEYAALLDSVQKSVFRKFGLAEEIPQSVHEMDLRLLATERRDFMLDTEPWDALVGIDPIDYGQPLHAWQHQIAARKFVARFWKLTVHDPVERTDFMLATHASKYRTH